MQLGLVDKGDCRNGLLCYIKAGCTSENRRVSTQPLNKVAGICYNQAKHSVSTFIFNSLSTYGLENCDLIFLCNKRSFKKY